MQNTNSTNAYTVEAQALDDQILACIRTWHNGGEIAASTIDHLLIKTAQHQLRYNQPYCRYALARGININEVQRWQDIPLVPATAFKETNLATFPAAEAQLCFQTSGTSQQRRGKHFLENARLYEAASGAIFQRLVLAPLHWEQQKIRILHLCPESLERPDSSLGYMVTTLLRSWGDAASGGFIHNDTLDIQDFREAVAATATDDIPLCIIGTAIAFAQFFNATGCAPLPVSANTIIIETGGFKGQQHTLDKATLYAQLAHAFHLAPDRIFAELGMTELASQYYDTPASRLAPVRLKTGPPWLRPRVIDAQGAEAAPGTLGILCHYDLANRSSVLAIETEDLAIQHEGGLEFIGRETGAQLRGCSLDAEDLHIPVEPAKMPPRNSRPTA